MRALLLACVIGVAASLAPVSIAAAQEASVRFEVIEAGDTTFAFPVGRHQWVAPGREGIVVDPTRRDVLVARFTVVRVGDGRAEALITGQTTRVTTDHIALLDAPVPSWWRRRYFWMGATAGAIVVAILGAVARSS